MLLRTTPAPDVSERRPVEAVHTIKAVHFDISR